jgi:CRP-like cAMP-binding protein
MNKPSQPSLDEIIRASSFTAELTEEQCAELAKIATPRHLKDGETLIHEGRIDNSVHVLIRGNLAVVKEAEGGAEEHLHTLKPGELAGAMGFIDGMEHTATLRSMGETELFSIERDKLESLLHSHPVLVYRVMRAIMRSVHAIVRRMNSQYVQMTNYITKQRGRY